MEALQLERDAPKRLVRVVVAKKKEAPDTVSPVVDAFVNAEVDAERMLKDAEDAMSEVAVVVASVLVPVTERVEEKLPVVPVIAPKFATVE